MTDQRRKLPFVLHAATSSASFESSRTSGGLTSPRKLSSAPTRVTTDRGFYEALKAVYGPSHQVLGPLRSTDGQALLTDKVSILNRWAEHFQTLFSADRAVDDAVIQHIPQQPMKEELDAAPAFEEDFFRGLQDGSFQVGPKRFRTGARGAVLIFQLRLQVGLEVSFHFS
ncbi:hypothetical protein ACOMHN_033223 [Nucella lapillus]